MAVLGVLLVVIALVIAGAGLWAASQPGAQPSTVEFFGNASYSLSPLAMMLMGAIAVLLLLLGLWLMTAAGKRSYRGHRERRDLLKQQRQQEKELEKTRAELSKRGETPDRERPAAQEPVSRHESPRTRPDERITAREERMSRPDERAAARDEPTRGSGPRRDDTYDDGARGGIRREGRDEQVRRDPRDRRDI